MAETQTKSAIQKAEEGTFKHLVVFMCGKTFSRHALLSEEDFLKEIGFDPKETNEADAVRLAKANLLNAISSRVIQIKEALKTTRIVAIARSGKTEEEIMQLIKEKKEKENGTK